MLYINESEEGTSLKPSVLFLPVRSADETLSYCISVLSSEKKFGLLHNVSE